MTTRKQVLALAERLGVEIEERGGECAEILATAPTGHHFACDDIHELVTPYGPDSWDPDSTKADAWADLMDRLDAGVEPCTKDTPCSTMIETGACEWWSEED